jgi:hypothetical protein
LETTNTYITPPSARGKPVSQDAPADRENWLSALKIAATRSRLETNILENLFTSLRHKRLDCAGVREQLRNEGLLDRLGRVQ